MELNRKHIEKSLDWLDSLVGNSNDSDIALLTYQLLGILYDTCEELTEENERLRGILLQFTDIVHKWGNKHGYDTSEISLVPILNEATAIKSQIEADTVRKMRERLKEHLEKPEFPWDSFTVAEEVIDQIAKEMLGGAE